MTLGFSGTCALKLVTMYTGIDMVTRFGHRMSTELKEFKWERRKKISGTYAPPPRSGCTMALWANSPIRSMGILFGGVRDVDESEEALTSEFFNDM